MEIKRIVVTGGPGAGKTSVLRELQKRFVSNGKTKYYFVSESATEIINSGIDPQKINSIYNFQDIIYDWQEVKENVIDKSLTFDTDFSEVVIFYDRGILDNGAYFNTRDEFDLLLKNKQAKELELLDKYDLVLDLIGTANGNEKAYNLESNPARYESIDRSKELDINTSRSWIGHRHFKSFNCNMSLEQKINNVINYVEGYIKGQTTAEMKRYLVDTDNSVLDSYNDENSVCIDVTENYIDVGSDFKNLEMVLTKRTYKGNSTYFLSLIERTSNTLRYISDSKISKQQYDEMLKKYLISDIVQKKEISFMQDRQSFHLNLYQDFTTLELEENKDNEKLVIPDNIKIIKSLSDIEELKQMERYGYDYFNNKQYKKVKKN